MPATATLIILAFLSHFFDFFHGAKRSFQNVGMNRKDFRDKRAFVVNVPEGLHYLGKIDVAFKDLDKALHIPGFCFKVLKVYRLNPVSEDFDPVFGMTVEHNVPDVEISADPFGIEGIDEIPHFEGTEQISIPDVFHGDSD